MRVRLTRNKPCRYDSIEAKNLSPEEKDLRDWKQTFKIILGGQIFSLVGSAAAQFALVWYLTIRTGSPFILAIAGICAFLPQAVLGPFAGTWVDRVSRRKVMIAADSFVALVSLIMMIAALSGEPPVWLVFVIIFLRAIGSVFHAPALQASIPMIVPERYIEKMSGFNQLVFSGSNMLGPVLGALLFSLFSISSAMLLDVAGAVFAVGTLLMVRIPNPPPEPRKHIFAEMKEGVAAIRDNYVLRRMAWPMLLAVLFYYPVASFFPLMVNGYFDKTAWHSSLVEAVFAAGMLTASLVIGIRGGMKNKFIQMSLAIFALGIFFAAFRDIAARRIFLVCYFFRFPGNDGKFFLAGVHRTCADHDQAGSDGTRDYPDDQPDVACDSFRTFFGCSVCRDNGRYGMVYDIGRFYHGGGIAGAGTGANSRSCPGQEGKITF